MRQHLENTGIAINEEAQRARVLYRFDCAKIIMLDGVDIGLLKVNRDDNPWELIQIQLSPEYQGREFGEILIRQVLNEAQKAGAHVKLSVLKANPARKLYEKIGFRIIGESEYVYIMQYDSNRSG